MKITVNGEAFEVDLAHVPMSDALAIEREWKRRYAEWETELYAGSAEAACVLAWPLWRRDGREVPLQDVLGGTVDFDYSEMLRSIADGARELAAEAEAEAANPTTGAPDPDGTGTTSPATRRSSRKSST